jgi:hypothetical protein
LDEEDDATPVFGGFSVPYVKETGTVDIVHSSGSGENMEVQSYCIF